MTKFIDTAEGKSFIASGDSRETSPEIMEAIAFFANDAADAEAIWANGSSPSASVADIARRVTKDGLLDATDFVWGSAGGAWTLDAGDFA